MFARESANEQDHLEDHLAKTGQDMNCLSCLRLGTSSNAGVWRSSCFNALLPGIKKIRYNSIVQKGQLMVSLLMRCMHAKSFFNVFCELQNVVTNSGILNKIRGTVAYMRPFKIKNFKLPDLSQYWDLKQVGHRFKKLRVSSLRDWALFWWSLGIRRVRGAWSLRVIEFFNTKFIFCT